MESWGTGGRAWMLEGAVNMSRDEESPRQGLVATGQKTGLGKISGEVD